MSRKKLKQLGNPSHLGDMLEVVSSKSWLTLWTIVGFLIIVLVWSLVGSIPIKVEGRGVVMGSRGLFAVQARIQGTVMKLYVKPGDIVQKGDLIGDLFDTSQELKLANVEKKIQKLEGDLNKLNEEIAREVKAGIEASKRELAAKEYTVRQIEKDIVVLEKDVLKKKKLVDEGLISLSVLLKAEEKLITKKIELETSETKIASILADMAKGYRTEELHNKEQAVLRAKDERDLLQTEIESMKIISPFSGKVLDWLVSQGDFVTQGTSLAWMEFLTENEPVSQLVLGYLPIEKGKRVSVGDTVEIELTTINVQEFGYIIGKVTEVSQYAVSKKNIAKVIQNEGLANYLTGGNDVVVQATIRPEVDPDNPSGYKWTSGSGPSIKISTGTVCTLRAIIERVRPFYYVLPVWHVKSLTQNSNPKSEDL